MLAVAWTAAGIACVGERLAQHRAESHGQCAFPCLQSILTGESGSVEKHLAAVQDPKAVYQDKTCLLYSVSSARLLLITVS